MRRERGSIPEVVDRFTVSKDGRTYTFELKQTFRFHTGAPVTAQSFADAFNRVANPKLGVTGDGLHARDRRRRRGDRRQGEVDLRRPRARPLPVADPADQAGRRLHRPADDAVLLPDPAEHADRPGRDRQPGRLGPLLRRRADRQPADRAETQPLLPRRPPGERRPDRLDDRRDRRPACSPSSRTGSTTATSASLGGVSGRWPRSTASTGAAASSSSARRSRHGSSRSTTSGRRSRGRADPAQEGDQLRDRPAGAGPRVRLPRRQAHRPDAPPGARAAPRASTRSTGADPATAKQLLRPGEAQAAEGSSSTRTTAHPASH